MNEHRWVLADGKGDGQCGHSVPSEAERQKPWLTKDSPARDALREIVLNKRFLNTIPYYVNFRLAMFTPDFYLSFPILLTD